MFSISDDNFIIQRYVRGNGWETTGDEFESFREATAFVNGLAENRICGVLGYRILQEMALLAGSAYWKEVGESEAK